MKVCFMFREMELSSSKLKKLLIFQEVTCKAWKTNKMPALRKFPVPYDAFEIFTAVKDKEILSRNSLVKFPVKKI